ncbi:hypothetical protein THIX_60494 [Thiomonas sp. X19]|uniref:hypothetical protein n=1 Tax=Thiomonas sp. X19 TaxID=1050370 RepID=UPI000B6C1F28|nr:hypothetical protein [Thiomonas sp. X19]SCC94436.1 hypothetical protein THIX_60494 [Thiomonas sp. X19]
MNARPRSTQRQRLPVWAAAGVALAVAIFIYQPSIGMWAASAGLIPAWLWIDEGIDPRKAIAETVAIVAVAACLSTVWLANFPAPLLQISQGASHANHS